MSEPPGNRQDDLDWLYGREPDARPQPTRANEPDTDRPRVSTPAYEVNPPKPVAQQRPPRASRPPQHPPQPERPMAPTPGSQVRRQHRTPRWRRGLRMSVLALVAWLIFLVATPVYALGRMAEVDQSGSSERPPRQPGTATLLVGTDARDPGPGYQPVPGDEDLTSVRADTIMLLYRPPTGRSVLVSLPRDSYVPIPGFGQDKLNAAYAYGGPA
ncbi:MAG: LytR family transcriptional regulator, partial [Brooklawnia sp.]|nr:LytR family transcriptional regulator [Brooklawnia sp.]